MKTSLLILISIFSLNIYSQTNYDVSKLFALRLIEENILIEKNKVNDIIFHNSDVINIEIDTIGIYDSNILFFKFKLGQNAVKVSDEKLEIHFNSSSCDEYILAYNVENNQSYRLKGFNGNDLFFLLKSINQISIERKSIKIILSELNKTTIGLDFIEIYNALRKFNFKAECLKACSEPKPSHGKN